MGAPLRILGVDPGSLALGYGLIEGDRARSRALAGGVVRNPSSRPFPDRLREIDQALERLIREFAPTRLAVEKAFTHRDASAALKLGMVRGVVLLAGARAGLAIAEYTPLKVKKTVAGYGQAEKGQIAKLVAMTLKLDDVPKALDMTDAFAVALTDLWHSA